MQSTKRLNTINNSLHINRKIVDWQSDFRHRAYMSELQYRETIKNSMNWMNVEAARQESVENGLSTLSKPYRKTLKLKEY